MSELIYLAGPYSHDDPAVREWRYRQHAEELMFRMKRGENVFSPIVYSHFVCQEYRVGTCWETWRKLDLEILRRCTKMLVLALPGWRESRGLRAEMREAKRHGLPIEIVGCTWEEAKVAVVKQATEAISPLYDFVMRGPGKRKGVRRRRSRAALALRSKG